MDRGGIIEFEAPIHISHVMLVCPRCKEPARIGYDFLPEGGKARICRSCGDIFEFSSPEIERLQDEAAREIGFEIHGHKHQIFGRCRPCAEKPEAARRS